LSNHRAGALAAAFSAGVLVCTQLPSHPGYAAVIISVFIAILLALRSRRLHTVCAFLLGLALGLAACQSRLDDRLGPEMAGAVLEIEGVVSSVPLRFDEYTRFRFRPLTSAGDTRLPELLLLTWYRDSPELRIGEYWTLQVRLKPPWGAVNFAGPDRERWLFAEGIGGTGTVRSGQRHTHLPVHRSFPTDIQEAVRSAIARQVYDDRRRSVIQALALADRGGISPEDSRMLRNTGTAHLLAISGLHIGLAAMGGLMTGRALLFLVPLSRFGRLSFYLPYSVAVTAASLYASLAGMGVSTLRALLMSLAAATALTASRNVHPWATCLLALAAVLVLDPLAPLGAGFWFSFLAVFALLSIFQARTARLSWWKSPFFAQAAVFLVLLPAGAAWFNGVSIVGLAANLVAIPWVSFLVVPPVLIGVCLLPLSEALAGAAWSLAGWSVGGLLPVLEHFGSAQPHLLGARTVSAAASALALCGALLLLLPRGLPFRWLGAFMLAPLFIPAGKPAMENEMQVDALDVGQGTAIAVSTHNRLLLYDTGPGDGAGRDHVSSAVAPLLTGLGKSAPDLLVISHGDLDHSGGLHSFRLRYPATPILGSVLGSDAPVTACRGGHRWRWDGFSFRVLHPSPGLPYLRNNSSCVLGITNGTAGFLLAGDVDSSVEQRLLLEGLGRYAVMLAPHHGSESSSSPQFLERIAPAAAIATASLGNRFGFPREAVRARYQARGIPLWATGECGGLRIRIDSRGRVTAASARNERKRIWRWPAAEICP
jgi:competence protein ComEC